ncbi:hypothetical protein [Photobacterium profundum]|uniref:Lipoprotein n=1 Tax=Photobacterium profundum (strain SS9) TaxID=298386 RepID=Q6LSK3_PHOPR|nr:hypothetical protein [Photobacterium profundum]CAG19723.1 hypothetical protein PBPRA1312 [Photobacterium profundum SS9]
MYKSSAVVLLSIFILSACTNVSNEDARYLDVYSLCYEVANSHKFDRSTTLKVVATELEQRGIDMSNEQCKKGSVDGRHTKMVRSMNQQSRDVQLEAACIQSGGTWYISYCKIKPVKMDVNVYKF